MQVCINGREWLARKLDAEGIGYDKRNNCFTHIADLKRAQQLMDQLSIRNWGSFLNDLAGRRYRALRPISPEDSWVFGAIMRGEFHLQGIRNKDLRQQLYPEAEQEELQRQKASARAGRQLGLLRAHGLIYKVELTTPTFWLRPNGRAVSSVASPILILVLY